MRSRSSRAARMRIRPRSAPLRAAHFFCAVRARATAASTWAAPAAGSSASISPVAGLMTLKLAVSRGPPGCAAAGFSAAACARSRSRPSTKAVSSARALSLSASCHSERAARSHTPSIIAAIIEARLWASSPAIMLRRSLRRFESMRRW